MSQEIKIMDLFEVEEKGYRNEEEREFLTVLFTRLGWTNDDALICYRDSTIMVAFDVCDWKQRVALRSLRVDFNGTSILLGEVGSNLFDSELVADDPNVKAYKEIGGSPATFANLGAEWLFNEISRQIVLYEWITNAYHHKQYELADTKQPLCWSDSENKKRFGLGAPTKVTIVNPLNYQTSSRN